MAAVVFIMCLVITRFAPSPTGYLHLGNLRIAVISWVFSYLYCGRFYIRLDTTNLVTLSCYFQVALLKLLTLFHLFSFRVFNQLKRLRLYYLFTWVLFLNRLAYFFNGAVWFFVFCDHVAYFDFGRFKLVSVFNITDFVLVRSSYIPTYNFCSVIDDHLLGISHVFRGSDHLTNTGKQLLISTALGFKLCSFIHLPLMLDALGNKLSKRYGCVYVITLLRCGVLRRALLCYLLNLDLSNCIKSIATVLRYSLNNCLSSNFRYDINKLICYNKLVIKSLSFIKVYCYLSTCYFSPLMFSWSIYNLLVCRSSFISDLDYLYQNYYLVLFVCSYCFFDCRIFYLLSYVLRLGVTLALQSKVVTNVFCSNSDLFQLLNRFFFVRVSSVPSLYLFLFSLGYVNIRYILRCVLFI